MSNPTFSSTIDALIAEATSSGGVGYSGSNVLGAPAQRRVPEPPRRVPHDYTRVLRSLIALRSLKLKGARTPQ